MSSDTDKASLATMHALMSDLSKMLTPEIPTKMPQEWVDKGQRCEPLGPNYFAGRQIAEVFMEKFEAEYFKPLVDKFVEKFREVLWEQVQDSLLENVENGLQQAIWHQIDRSVEALLSGEEWALNKYVLGTRYDCDKIREAVAKHIPVELQDKRIADLEAQLAEAKKSLEYSRRY